MRRPVEDAPPADLVGQVPEIHRRRFLTWHACRNVRDLGGLPLEDGGRTGWHAVVRADDLCQLTAEGQSALRDYGVRTIVDLRAHFELDQRMHPYRPPYAGAPSYLHLPSSGDETSPLPAIVSAPSLQDGYVHALRLRRPQYGTILTAIARARDGGVVVHCVSGKDRTGLVVALLLALVGVPDAVIVEDYALSGLYLRDSHLEEAAAGSTDPGVRSRLAIERLSPPGAILTALAFLREEYGSVETYLRGADVSMRDMRLLRARLRGDSAATRR